MSRREGTIPADKAISEEFLTRNSRNLRYLPKRQHDYRLTSAALFVHISYLQQVAKIFGTSDEQLQ